MHCTNLGFGRKELNDAAYEQMQKLAQIFSGPPNSNIQAIEYAAELAEVMPGDINHCYFTSIGSESNEVAIQIVRFYWQVRGAWEKYKIICLSHAYHGATALTRSISNHLNQTAFGREYPGVVRIPNFHCYRCPYNLKYPSCDILCARMLEEVIETEGEDTVACFIAEPVQGAEGVLWPPDEYWPIVRDICTRRNVLLIDDEVMAGFCRTGKMFAIENWNVVPDIMAMSKGINAAYLPFGAVGVSDKVYKHIEGKELTSVTTSSGNATCVATARAALKIYKVEKLAERAARLGNLLHKRLVEEFLPLPCVDDVMGRGLFQSFEIALNKTTDSKFNYEASRQAREQLLKRCFENGVFACRSDGYPRRQPVGPPCIISEEDLDKALGVMLGAMKEIRPV
ncbi:aspartate aminotransferase family protein [Chloroflexota bacterium]